MRFASRTSSRVNRSSNIVCGAISGTVAVEVHTAAPRQAARLRFKLGAISALVAA